MFAEHFCRKVVVLLKADTITKDYVKDVSIFADIFNYYVYGGRQVILPEQLAERDSTKIALPYGTDDAVVPVQKFRFLWLRGMGRAVKSV